MSLTIEFPFLVLKDRLKCFPLKFISICGQYGLEPYTTDTDLNLGKRESTYQITIQAIRFYKTFHYCSLSVHPRACKPYQNVPGVSVLIPISHMLFVLCG